MTRLEALEAVARKALYDWDRNTCTHEDTHRGGLIWTICDGCGRKWADDEGGFQPYSDPPGIAGLRAALDALPAAPTQGNSVEVAIWRTDVEYRFSPLTQQASRVLVGAGYSRLGTTLLTIHATEGGGE
jgi:hypothetical protein